MLIIPITLTIAVSILATGRYGGQASVLPWALVPMWLCYAAVAFCDILHIL